MNVFFEDSNKQQRLIGTAKDQDGALRVIRNFLEAKEYISYYTRIWKVDIKTTKVDVGSHSEFFYIVED